MPWPGRLPGRRWPSGRGEDGSDGIKYAAILQAPPAAAEGRGAVQEKESPTRGRFPKALLDPAGAQDQAEAVGSPIPPPLGRLDRVGREGKYVPGTVDVLPETVGDSPDCRRRSWADPVATLRPFQ
jgi:hypothetical protein